MCNASNGVVRIFEISFMQIQQSKLTFREKIETVKGRMPPSTPLVTWLLLGVECFLLSDGYFGVMPSFGCDFLTQLEIEYFDKILHNSA